MSIEVRNLSKLFGRHAALRDVSVTVQSGELLALLGPSGSGKTTLLRVIAGLEAPDAGTVHFDGDDATTRSASDRRVGFVFQHYALFRHMTVFENVAFGLRVRPRTERPPETEIRRRVDELLALVQLDYLGGRHPSELSGGQRQRVALARALAVEPRVLLLDEPFGALDAKVRQDLRRWLRRLHSQIHLTSVFVTHDQEEALELADRVVVMNEGRIEQIGPPGEVVDHPATTFVMTFVGEVNMFRGRAPGGHAYARPHELSVSCERTAGSLPSTVRDVRIAGALVKIELANETDGLIQVALGRDRYDALDLRPGDQVFVTPTRLRVFAEK